MKKGIRDFFREILELTEVHPQEIALDQPRRELRVVRVEVGDALRVDLGAPRHYIAAAQQKLRQHTHAAPHFQHRARRRGGAARERVADLARNVQVGEKMLSQRLFSPYFRHNSFQTGYKGSKKPDGTKPNRTESGKTFRQSKASSRHRKHEPSPPSSPYAPENPSCGVPQRLLRRLRFFSRRSCSRRARAARRCVRRNV